MGTRLNRESTWATDFEEFDPALFPPLDASRTGLEPARRESSCPATPGGWLVGGMTCLGMISGGILGGLFFAQEPKLAGLIVGTISSVILGGFFGFAASSCSKVPRSSAWHEAKTESGPRSRSIVR